MMWSLRLVSVRPALAHRTDTDKWMDPHQAAVYVAERPVADGVLRSWYDLDPDKPATPLVDPDLDRRYWAHSGSELPSVYEWNLEFLRKVLCANDPAGYPYLADQFRRLRDVFVFEPADRMPYPTYRYLRNTHYPSGLVTNSFGWRGPEVPLNKPAGRIRIAFVGASTTVDAHRDPFSYPEYVGRWLREWANSRHPGISLDVINAGREGLLSNSIAAIVRQELLPLRPDLVVYYEGANQFWPNDFVRRPIVRMLRLASPTSLDGYSAIARRVQTLLERRESGAEPYKPTISVAWPADLDEGDPKVDDPRLPVQLPRILSDVDRMHQAIAGAGGTLMLSSFVWLAAPGLTLDSRRDALIYRELNERYWPFSYAHMRRFVDFENRVFQKYARQHHLPFNDLAAVYPADPRLFVDSIHMTPAGVKLKAWLVFQNLVPVLRHLLDVGAIPVPDPGGRRAHPSLAGQGRRLVSVDQIARSCRPLD